MIARESEGHASAVRIQAAPEPTAIATAESRLQEIKSRRLEIADTVAEWKRAFYCDGVTVPLTDRLTIQAEDARLMLELDTLKVAAERAKYLRREQERATLVYHLVGVLRKLDPLSRDVPFVIQQLNTRRPL